MTSFLSGPDLSQAVVSDLSLTYKEEKYKLQTNMKGIVSYFPYGNVIYIT